MLRKNWGLGAKQGQLGQLQAATQMGQLWDTLGPEQHFLQGGQVGRGEIESDLTGGGGKGYGAGEISWNRWHF